MSGDKLPGLSDATEALRLAVEPATELANVREDMDWGKVSDLGCDAIHAVERALGILESLRAEHEGDERC